MDWQELGMTAARAAGVCRDADRHPPPRKANGRQLHRVRPAHRIDAREVVDEIIYGDVSLAQGFTAILVVAAAKYVTAWLTCSTPGLSRLLEGKPTELVKNGEVVRSGLRKELMNEKEVMAALRLQGVADVREVKLALLEVDGVVSVIREDWAEPLKKSDVLGDEAEKVSPDAKRTDAAEAI